MELFNIKVSMDGTVKDDKENEYIIKDGVLKILANAGGLKMNEYYKIKKENFDKMYESAKENVINENEMMYMFDRGYKSALENMTYLFENKEVGEETIRPVTQHKSFKELEKETQEMIMFEKLTEEIKEFSQSLPSKRENSLEEAFDVIQIVYNILDVKGFTEQDIQKGIEVHNEKLKLRGWKFKGEEK